MEALGNIIIIVVGLSLTPWVQARSRHRQVRLGFRVTELIMTCVFR